jgi:hypothetical protein
MRLPFEPFLIEFVSADRILVSHPEAVDRSGDLFLYRSSDGHQRVFAAVNVCQLIEPPAGPDGA